MKNVLRSTCLAFGIIICVPFQALGGTTSPVVTVTDNVLESADFPKLKLRVNKEFQYVTDVSAEVEGNNSSPETKRETPTLGLSRDSYLFLRKSSDPTKFQLFAVTILTTKKSTAYFPADPLGSIPENRMVESGTFKIYKDVFKTVVMPSNYFSQNEKQTISDQGVTVPLVFLAKSYTKNVSVKGRTVVILTYAEPILFAGEEARNWLDIPTLNDEQKTFTQDFLKHSAEVFQVIPLD